MQVEISTANSKIQKKAYNSVATKRPYSTHWMKLIQSTNKQLSNVRIQSSPIRRKQKQAVIKAQYELPIPTKPISFTSNYLKEKSCIMPLPNRIEVEKKERFEVCFYIGKYKFKGKIEICYD